MKKLVSLLLCLAIALAWLPAGSPFAAAADPSSDMPDDLEMGVKISDLKLFKRRGYEVTFLVSNTMPWERNVTFYGAVYTEDRKMVSVVSRQETLGAGESHTVTMPLLGEIETWGFVRVFCLNSSTKEPYCSTLAANGFQAQVIQELDYITTARTRVEGTVGGMGICPVVTAHYINGGEDREISASQVSISVSGDEGVVTVRQTDDGAELVFGHEGSATLTITYTEDGISKCTQVPVIVFEPVWNLGFLADPDADPLPADAIPISNAQELAEIGTDSFRKTYYLTNDIQLTEEWEPHSFEGTLDGRGHTISGLYVLESSNRQQAGLFSEASFGVIKNLAVEIDPRGVTASDVVGRDPEEITCAGGLAGKVKNTSIINCYTTGGPVSARGVAPHTGGLAGNLMNQSAVPVTNCFSTCDVSAVTTKDEYGNMAWAGGLIGRVDRWDIFVQREKFPISRCYAAGDVSIEIEQFNVYSGGIGAGGLIGCGNFMKINDSFAVGNVSAKHTNPSRATLNAGGLGGTMSEVELSHCYAAGNVETIASDPPGSQCLTYIGGLAAAQVDKIYQCYRLNQIVTGHRAHDFIGGTKISEPYEESSYAGFDFDSTWTFTEGAFQGLPHLQYQD